jgi:hypothetical protein
MHILICVLARVCLKLASYLAVVTYIVISGKQKESDRTFLRSLDPCMHGFIWYFFFDCFLSLSFFNVKSLFGGDTA